MATLTVQSKTALGKSFPLAAAAAGGDVVPNTDGGVVVIIKNQDASAKTVTVKSYFPGAAPEGTTKADLATVVGASEVAILGPFSSKAWNNGLNQIELTYSAVTSVTVAAYKGS